MLEIALGVTLFVAIVMCLAVVILLARSKLVPSGQVNLTINDEKVVTVPVGGKLLGALTDADVNLPSACGGIGTCGLCTVTVLEGGGPVLPVERSRMTKSEIAEGTRLACQVPVRRDMRIRLPDEILGVRQWICTVRSNQSVASLIKELILELPAGEPMQFKAGAFIQVVAPPYTARFADFEIDAKFHPVWDDLNLWRFEAGTAESTVRAYSMANYPDEEGIVMLNIRIAIPPPDAPPGVPPGVVSSYLFSLKPGDEVTISGPYGYFFAKETEREMVFIGGGAGMAPLRALIFDQLERRRSQRKIVFWYGARSRQELFYVEDFDRLEAEYENFRWFTALSEPKPEDDWEGFTGFIHAVAYEHYLKDHPAPEECEYYLCGPTVMIRAVIKMLDSLGVEQDNILFDDFGG